MPKEAWFNGIVVFHDPGDKEIPRIVDRVKTLLPASVGYVDASGASLLMISGMADTETFREAIALIEGVEHRLAGASRLIWGDREHLVGPEKRRAHAWH